MYRPSPPNNDNVFLPDANDGKEWSDADIWDLKNSLAQGRSIEEVTEFLCRQGTPDDVRHKADELGLKYR